MNGGTQESGRFSSIKIISIFNWGVSKCENKVLSTKEWFTIQ